MVEVINNQPLLFELESQEIALRTMQMDVHHYHPIFGELISFIKKAQSNGYSVYDLAEISTITRILGFETTEFVKYVNQGIPYLRVQNVKENKIDLTGVKYISEEAHEKLKRSQLKPKDVVMTITGRVGTVAVITPEIACANASQEIVRIRVNDTIIEPEYLAIYLNSEIGKNLLERLFTGSTRARTLIRNVRRIPIVTPNKKEQLAIVAKMLLMKKQRDHKLLEAKMALEKANKIVFHAYETIYSKIGIKIQPMTDKIFFVSKDELDNRLDVGYYLKIKNYIIEPKYPIIQLDEMVDFSELTVDPTKKPLQSIKYVQIQDVDAVKSKIVSYSTLLGRDASDRARRVLKEGDIITAMSGSATGTANHSTAIISKEFDNCVATTGFGVLRPKENIDGIFLFFMLKSPYILDEIKRRLTGATIPAITKTEFKKIRIPLAPLEIQHEIAAFLTKATLDAEVIMSEATLLKSEAKEIEADSNLILKNFLLNGNS